MRIYEAYQRREARKQKTDREAAGQIAMYAICREFHWLPSQVEDEPAVAIQRLLILHSVFSAKQAHDMEQMEAESRRVGK